MTRSGVRSEISLIIAALLIAFVIWIMAKMSTQQTEPFTVPIVLENVPPSVNIVDYEPKTLPLIVTFPQGQRTRVSNQNFEVRLDLQDILGKDPRTWAGERNPSVRTVDLTLDNVHRNNVPESVRVAGLGQPARIQLKAVLYSQSYPVKAETTGNVAPNYELREIRVNPPGVFVTGASETLSRLTEANTQILTQPISLEGKNKDFIDFVELRLPPNVELLRPAERKVEVVVGIKEKEITRTIEDVPVTIFVLSPDLKAVTSPSRIQVRVKGPISTVNQIDSGMFSSAPKESLAEEPGPRKSIELVVGLNEEVSKEIREKTEIESFSPTRIEIEFVPIERTPEKSKSRSK